MWQADPSSIRELTASMILWRELLKLLGFLLPHWKWLRKEALSHCATLFSSSFLGNSFPVLTRSYEEGTCTYTNPETTSFIIMNAQGERSRCWTQLQRSGVLYLEESRWAPFCLDFWECHLAHDKSIFNDKAYRFMKNVRGSPPYYILWLASNDPSARNTHIVFHRLCQLLIWNGPTWYKQ